MAAMTLSQAAKASGKSKSTLSRAIKTGRLSATRLDDGNFSIDPAELFRAYPGTPYSTYEERHKEWHATPVPTELQSRISMLELLLEKEREAAAREREISADLKEDRDKWRQQATSLLADLRVEQKIEPETFRTQDSERKTTFDQIPPRPWLWRIIKLKGRAGG